MTLGGYRDAGGVEGAIAQTAEETLDKLIAADPNFEKVTREIFLDLTELGEGTEDTRRAASRTELSTGVDTTALDTVLEELVEARLITMRKGEVEVAHEALIRRWPTLKEWLADNRERLRFERQLQRDAQVWADLERDDGALYRGAQLARAAELVDSGEVKLTDMPAEFLLVSRELAEREEREREEQRQRELENAQKLATAALAREEAEIEARNAAEAQRESEESARQQAEADAANLRQRAVFLVGALVVAAILAVAAIFFFNNARNSAQEAKDNLAQTNRALIAEETAQAKALANLSQAQTKEAEAQQSEALALTSEAGAFTAQATAEAESTRAIKAEGTAEAERKEAERQSRVALGQSLAALASSANDANLTDIDLNLLLALEALHLHEEFKGNAQFLVDESLRDLLSRPDLRRNLSSHTEWVVSVAFSPDGQQIASGSNDQTVRVWDLTDPATEPLLLSGHIGSVNSVAFSLDGQQIASGSGDQTVRVWNLATPAAEPILLSTHSGSVWSVAFSPDGQQIASGSSDDTVRVWDLANPAAEPLLFSGHTGSVNSVAFDPDGQRIASGSNDLTVRVWDLANPTAQPLLLNGHTRSVNSVAFSSDGQQIASGSSDQTVRVWDLANPSAQPLLLSGHSSSVYSVAFSPNGQQIASGSNDQTARVWDLINHPAEPLLLIGHTGSVNSVAFSPDGQQIASGSERPNGAHVGPRQPRSATDSCSAPILVRGQFGGLRARHAGRSLPAVIEDAVWVWDLANPTTDPFQARWPYRLWVNSVAFSSNRQQIASGSDR